MARIAVVGSNNTDLVTYITRMPAGGETLDALRFEMGPGGKGANQAVAAARLGSDVLDDQHCSVAWHFVRHDIAGDRCSSPPRRFHRGRIAASQPDVATGRANSRGSGIRGERHILCCAPRYLETWRDSSFWPWRSHFRRSGPRRLRPSISSA